MSAATLDLSRSRQDHAATLAEALRTRLAGVLGGEPERMAFASGPVEAKLALATLSLPPWEDRTEAGPAALDGAGEAPGGGVLYRIGPEDAPVCVFAAPDGATANLFADAVYAPAPILLQAALDAITPAARLSARAEIDALADALKPVIDALSSEAGIAEAAAEAEGLRLSPKDSGALKRLFDAWGVVADWRGEAVTLHVATAAQAKALAARIGAKPGRVGAVRRTTKETDLAIRVDLDGRGTSVDTGVRFFDHMLEQVAKHGDLRLEAACTGDVDVDAHHTIEDVCLGLGEALREALGDKRGVGRFGFALPMDETRAGVWIDLSGRPYARFDGEIPGERVNDFPVEMTAHCFRSIAESLKAAVHVEVDGENAHHMIESCFKAFGRALRQAKTIEGDALPSTKGVL